MVEDIEKISILKNGTAIYGAKGANGVILIETKRNKSMATKIDVSIGGSFELLPKSMDMIGWGTIPHLCFRTDRDDRYYQ